MEEQKVKITAYVQPKTAELVEKQYKLHGCRSRSEFIDAAIQFYLGFLNAKDYSGYLPNIVISTMKGALGSLEHRLAKGYWRAMENNRSVLSAFGLRPILRRFFKKTLRKIIGM